jgi:hypothetical protein
MSQEPTPDLTDLADGTLSGPEWDAWRVANPEAAAEVLAMRQASALVAELQLAQIALPSDFEQQVLTRIRRDAVFRELLQFGFPQLGRAFIELLTVFFGFLPAPAEQEAPAATGGAL